MWASDHQSKYTCEHVINKACEHTSTWEFKHRRIHTSYRPTLWNLRTRSNYMHSSKHMRMMASEHVIIKECEHSNMWESKHVSNQGCEQPNIWTWEHTIIEASRHVRNQGLVWFGHDSVFITHNSNLKPITHNPNLTLSQKLQNYFLVT